VLTVDVRLTGCHIEWPKRYIQTHSQARTRKIIVEQFLPSGSMHACRERDHVV